MKKRKISVTGMAVMILATIFFACKEEVPVTGVKLDQTALMLTVGKTAVLKATVEPTDATVQTVTWSAEPSDAVTLTDNKDGSCTVKGIKEGTATVTVKTADGGKTAQCAVTVYDSNTIINLAFIKAVEQATETTGNPIGWTKEADGTVKVTPENRGKIRAVTELNIEGSFLADKKLTDLSGIEYFTNLTYLNCSSHELSSLDVSKNTEMTTLWCGDNQLTSLDVSKNTALTMLWCNSNRLTSLDVSANTALTILRCGMQTADGSTSQMLTLTLTADQKTTWDNEWITDEDNENVKVEAK